MYRQRALAIAVLAAAAPAAQALSERRDAPWQCIADANGAWTCTAAPGAAFTVAGTDTPDAVPVAAASVAQRPKAEEAPAPATPIAGKPPAAAGVPDAAAAIASGTRTAERPSDLDWVDEALLTPDETARVSTHCGGVYVEPEPPPLPTRGTSIGTIHASSDESELLQQADVARFRGNVTVRQDERWLHADQATYFRKEERVEINGHVQYREPGLMVQGEKARLSTADKTGELEQARFVMHTAHARGEAGTVLRNADRSIDLRDGRYTHCEPGNNDWELVSDNIHLDRDSGQGIAHDARLEVRGVPVLYTPYLRFPIDERRMSGFLWPEFTNSSQNGLDIATPYYFNLAPNYDATLVPRYLVDRGAMLGGEGRYLDRFGEWVANGSYLPDDDVHGDNRWLTSLRQVGGLPGTLQTQINYTEVSDEDYFRNLGATGLDVKRATHLAQTGGATWLPADEWQVQLNAMQFQLLDPLLPEPYRILPRLSVANRNTPEPFQPDFVLEGEYTAFDHMDSARITGERLYAAPSLVYPMEWPFGFVRPTVGYQSLSYQLERPVRGGDDDSPSIGAPLASLDAGLVFERAAAFSGKPLLQTLEPRLFYLWSDYEDHSGIPVFDSQNLTFGFAQLFRTSRFAGHDRIADANQASLSLTSRLIDDTDGQELASASIGQISYFEDRLVAINTVAVAQEQSNSALAAELQLQPGEQLSISSSAIWDPGEEDRNGRPGARQEPREHGVLVHWTPDSETIVNASYRYRRDQLIVDPLGNFRYEDIDQYDLSTALPISEHWKLLARYQYDLTNDNSLEETVGVEYSSCCWALRMVYQEGLDWEQGRDYGVYVEFVLRGLGGLGRNIDQLLQKSIFGYGEYEQDYRLAN